MSIIVIVSITSVIISMLLLHALFVWNKNRLNYKLQKAINEEALKQFTACYVNTKCPCFKEYINVPFHPQAGTDFKCPKCDKNCGFSIEMKTFLKG